MKRYQFFFVDAMLELKKVLDYCFVKDKVCVPQVECVFL